MTPDNVEPWLRVAWEIYRKEPLQAGEAAEKLAALGVNIQDQAFFASRVENMQFLNRSQNLIFDYLARSVEDVIGPDGVTRKALTVASRGQFTALMRDFMVKEGMATEEEFPSVNHKSVRDIRSQARLELIFDTQVNLAYGNAQKAAGLLPDALESYPAWELVRLQDRMEPRHWPSRWIKAGGELTTGDNDDYPDAMGRMIALKTDPIWTALGSKSLFPDALDVSVPPFAWQSGMGWRAVSRAEWESNGGGETGDQSEPPTQNPRSSASLKNIDPEIKKKALEALRKQRDELERKPSINELAKDRARRVREELSKPWPPIVGVDDDDVIMY